MDSNPKLEVLGLIEKDMMSFAKEKAHSYGLT